jgi:hypothetical protein
MNLVLNDVLRQLDLQPGESRCVVVDDYEVEIRRTDSLVDDSGPMMSLWLDVPLSPNAITIVAKRGAPQLPAPFEVHESDLAPE